MTRPAENSPEHRAAVVAGIRALADFIEQRTDLPVPDSVAAQHSQLDANKTDETVRAAAAALGIDPIMHGDSSGMSVRHDLGGKYGGAPYAATVTYVVHGFLPAADEPETT